MSRSWSDEGSDFVILVFGSDGQLGRALRRLAQARRTALLGIPLATADIAACAAVERTIADAKPVLVVNAAAYTAVDRAESEPDAASRANALGPAVLAEVCA